MTDEEIPASTRAAQTAALFTPFRLGSLTLPNRFVMAPMSRALSPNGTITDELAAYYARRAAGGVGFIITEGLYVSEDAGPSTDEPRLFGTEQLESLRRLVDSVHAAGGRIAAQLWHLGSYRGDTPRFNPQMPTLSPSGIHASGARHGRPAAVEELDRIREDYGRAAAAAKAVGFDAVEVYGAHGYFLDQFLWEGTNLREDRYGGSLEARLRYPAEVTAAVREAVGPDYPVIFRFSQWRVSLVSARIAQTPDELGFVLRTLAESGASAFHASARQHWAPAFPELDGGDGRLSLAGWTRRLSGLPTIAVGSVGLDQPFEMAWQEGGRAEVQPLSPLLEQLGRDEFDLVAVGRVLLSDPEWVTKVRQGRTDELRPFLAQERLTLH